ncbi:hypothetical protein M758_1G281200 [Ceratodon purpureus]|uniref:Phytocyanin domain-containing protein n=1 Tax=Ceratodon purpureus TaxID=3225 RepID=A0A8T0JD17_CERPU|nr:hypothetical protein KC19_1G289700 [Ceratodon purpureus]KAG0631818.1 hypothetical protein M758_1G281200 [Ceratodon purpureus]
MAQGRCSAVLAVALLVASFAIAVQGIDYTVGDTQGWTKPNGNSIPATYLQTWATGKTFNDGDNLIFNYNTVAHSLLQVSATDYNGCIVTAPLERYVTGKDTIKLAGGTTYYFICGTGGHCDAGQKLSITTSGTPGATTPAPSAAAPRINVAAVLQASVAATFAFVAAIALW